MSKISIKGFFSCSLKDGKVSEIGFFHSFHPCECELCNDLKYNFFPLKKFVDRNSKTLLASVPTGKIDVSSIFFPLQEGSDKLVRAGLLICTCRGSFSLKGA